MMHKPVRFSLWTLALFGLTLIFGCRTETPSDDGGAETQTVRVRLANDLTTLNPYLYRTNQEANVFDLMFQYPLQFDMKTLKLSPQLAKAMPEMEEITEGEYAGGRAFRFEFFEEAVWDDGTPITGYDYEFTMKAIFNPAMPTQRFAAWIDYIREVRVDAENPKKFTVYTAHPYLVDREALSNYVVLPKHLYDPNGLLDAFSLKDLTDPEKAAKLQETDDRLAQFAEAFQAPELSRSVFYGSGPYRFVEWVEGQVITLEKKADWWGDELAAQYPLLDARPARFEFKPIPDNAAAMVALQDGAIDLMSEMDSKAFLEAKENAFISENFNFFTPLRLAFFYIALNNENPKLSDKRVRKALAHCLDLKQIIETTYEGFGEPLAVPFLPDKSYFHKGLKPVEQNFERAKALLTEAGWTDTDGDGIVDKVIDGKKQDLSLEFLYMPNVPFQTNLSALVQENARKVGIDIQRVPVEGRELGKRLRQRAYEMVGRGAGSNPVPDDPKQFFHCESARAGGSNYMGFCSPEADEVIDRIRKETDLAERDRLYRKLQEILYEEQPMIILFSPKNKIILHKRFKDPIISKLKLGVSLQHLHG